MDVSSISGSLDFFAQQASALQGGKIQQQIGVSVLKQALDQQKAAGDALVRMIQETAVQRTPGSPVDIRV